MSPSFRNESALDGRCSKEVTVRDVMRGRYTNTANARRAMVEAVQPSSSPLFDVTRIASLRKQLGHAATALKVSGILSGFFVGVYLSNPFGLLFASIVALLTPGCAFLIAKRLRSGRTWAVGLAAIWFLLFAADQVLDALPKALRAGISSYDLLGMIIMLAPLYFLARGLIYICYLSSTPTARSNAAG